MELFADESPFTKETGALIKGVRDLVAASSLSDAEKHMCLVTCVGASIAVMSRRELMRGYTIEAIKSCPLDSTLEMVKDL